MKRYGSHCQTPRGRLWSMFPHTFRLRACWVWPCLLFSCAAATFAAQTAESSLQRPNIVIVLADDLGWADLTCYGSSFHRTPALDRLAVDGVRFRQAYASAPICSPTRAALLTGLYPARLHLTDWLPGRPDRPDQKLSRPIINQQLPTNTLTLPEALREAGYATAAIGKWHLGGKGSGPKDHGFDYSVAGNQSGSPPGYFFPYAATNRTGRVTIPGLDQGESGEYLTERLTREAEQFIDRNRSNAFFLYLSHYAVHIPLMARQEVVASYAGKALPGSVHTNAVYAAMLENLDQSVGRVIKKLDELGLRERTLVIFTSDNGGLSVREGPLTPATSNHPLRAGKGHLYEGGLRVPWIMSWPGTIFGGRVWDHPVQTADLFATCAAAARLARVPVTDGVNLLGPLRENFMKPRELFWHYPHYSNQGGKPGCAIRSGHYKLIQFFESDRAELYDLSQDPSETNNLANQDPERVQVLRRALERWQNRVDAQAMSPHAAYDPTADPSELPAPPNSQSADGIILLPARDVIIHGERVRYEPQPHKNTVGYWTRLQDWISWEFSVHTPGTFELSVLQGCGPGSGGSVVDFTIGDETVPMTVQETKGFQDFVPRVLGTIHITAPGRQILSVKPRVKPGLAVMDLRSVTLKLIAPKPK